MTSKQRVRAVFNGERPDKVPTAEQAFASSVASEILGYEAYTGSTDLHYFEACAWLNGDAAHDEFAEKCFADTVALHRKLKLDIFFLPWRMREKPTKRLDDNTILYGDPDGNDWRVYSYDPNSRTYGLRSSAKSGESSEAVLARVRADVDAFDKKSVGAPTVDEFLLRALREVGNEFEVAGGAGCALPMAPGWLEATIDDPGLLAAWFEIQGWWQSKEIAAQREAGVWLINGGGDLAFNSGLIYSPSFYLSAVHPAFKAQFTACRALDMKYIFRSDGNLWAISDDLFGPEGAHAYYEVDSNAGMTFDRLRSCYPELVLLGNVDSGLLCTGTAREVASQARWCVEKAAPRLVLGSANAVLHGTPAENVYAMLEEAGG